jgi:hypothetical protein
MRAFFGGQIKAWNRGGLSAIIREGSWYEVFVHSLTSKEFIYKTGDGDTDGKFIKRAYFGISEKAGDLIVALTRGKKADKFLLEQVDELIVSPEVNLKYKDKPDRIIIEHTAGGYEVTETE